MRKIIFAIFVLCFLSAGAQMHKTSDYNQYLCNIGKRLPDNEPSYFWKAFNDNFPRNKEIRRDMKKGTKTVQRVLEIMGDLSHIRRLVSSVAIDNDTTKALIDTLYSITKIREAFPMVEFFIVHDEQLNAGMFPDGTCVIYDQWLKEGSNLNELVAIMAHEISHYILIHRFSDYYNTIKAEKRGRNLAEAGTVLAATVYGISQINAAQNGVNIDANTQQQMYDNITKAGVGLAKNAEWYAWNRMYFKYSRDTEMEADVVAFWFLKRNGYDPRSLIEIFKKIDKENPVPTIDPKTGTHPETSERIKYIEKLIKKYNAN